MRALTFLTCLIVITAGCQGPLPQPMVFRLDDDMQKSMDDKWRCMLAPPDRADHTLLVDAIIEGHMHEWGIDRGRFVSEKDVGDGRAVMEVNYERANPEADEFVFAYFDPDGNEIRREEYSRQEVEERISFFYGPMTSYGSAGLFDERPKLSRAKREQLERERQARRMEISALQKPLVADVESKTGAD